jgi:hypothetical protein
MERKCYFILILILLLPFGNVFSQKKIIDSLQKRLNNKELTYFDYNLYKADLALALRFIDIERSKKLIQKALIQSNKSDLARDAKINAIAARIYRQAEEYTKMVAFCEKAIILANQTKENDAKAFAYYAKALVGTTLDDEKQIDYLFIALKHAEKTTNYALISTILYLISGDFANTGNVILEKKYTEMCLKKAIESKDPETIVFALQAMNSNFFLQHNKTKKQVFLDSATVCIKKGIKLFLKKKEYIVKQDQLGVMYLNLANNFFYKIPQQKDSVIHYTNKALENGLLTKHNDIIVNAYGLQSEIAKQEKDYNKVKMLLNKAISNVSNKYGSSNFLKAKIYESLYNIDKECCNYKEALVNIEKYNEFNEKFVSEEQKKNMHLYDAKYELAKKTDQIKFLDEKNRLNLSQKYLSYGIVGILVICLLFMFSSYNYRLKLSIEKQKLSEANEYEAQLQAELLEEKAKLKEQEANSLKIEQKLIIAQKTQLQNEVLAGTLQIDHKNDLLKNMKEKILDENIDSKTRQKISNIIKEETRLDKDFETVKNEIKNIHPEFFQKLQKRSKNKLTPLDLKYCSYIKLNLPTKQLSTMLNVETSSIRMNKYRIKQKIGLSKEDDLYSFLNSIV